MVEIGQYACLRVLKHVDFGLYLDGENLGEILLPKRYTEDDMEIGHLVDVFIYKDSEDRLTAITERPRACVGECANFPVAEVNDIGAFLDWGLPKDLLVPFNEQRRPLQAGRSAIACLYLDPHSNRIVASTKIDKRLSETSDDFVPGQAVSLLIYTQTDLGMKAIINHTHLGMIMKSDLLQPLKAGQTIKGYIKYIRPDLRIDLALQPPMVETRDELCDKIIAHLNANGGESELTDKAAPDAIFQQFGVSKSSYKKALGRLYQQKQIRISKQSISLT